MWLTDDYRFLNTGPVDLSLRYQSTVHHLADNSITHTIKGGRGRENEKARVGRREKRRRKRRDEGRRRRGKDRDLSSPEHNQSTEQHHHHHLYAC